MSSVDPSFRNFYPLAKFSILLNIHVECIPKFEDPYGFGIFLFSDSCSLKFLQTLQGKHVNQIGLSKCALWLA